MHVRQRFQEIVPEQPDGLLRPVRRHRVVRHPASPTGQRSDFSRPAATAAAPGPSRQRRGASRAQPASQRLRGRGRAAGEGAAGRRGRERLAHDGRHLRRERRRRRRDLVPARHALDQARAFRAVRVVLAAAALQRVDHLAAARRRHEEHSLQPAVPVHLAFVSALELRLAVVVDVEELEGAPVDAERIGREVVEDDDVRPIASRDGEEPLDLRAEPRDLAVHAAAGRRGSASGRAPRARAPARAPRPCRNPARPPAAGSASAGDTTAASRADCARAR